MVEINLLPWREQKLQYERSMMQRYIVAGLAIACMMLLCLHVLFSVRNHRDWQRLQSMGAALPVVADVSQADRQTMDNAGGAVEFFSGTKVAAILDAAGKSTNNGICFQRIAYNESGLQLTGQAFMLQSLASGLRMLEASHLFTSVQFSEMKQETVHHDFQFVMQARVLNDERGE
jgi:Tfp pilus assembly protein PilN